MWGETYGTTNNSDLAFTRKLQNLSSRSGSLLPKVAETLVAFEIEVFVFVAEDVVGGEAWDLEVCVFCVV